MSSSPTPSWQANFSAQWQNPSDIFSLLLIVGGDIVQAAIAQLAGTTTTTHLIPIPAPVPFSFGWVAYAYNTLGLSIGEGRLMPSTSDVNSLVINGSNGISQANRSWVLGRLLRDIEPEYRSDVALRIDVYCVTSSRGWWARHDSIWWTAVTTILVQLAIAAVPAVVHGDWMNLIVTFGGTLLALTHTIFPQWGREKWACRNLKPYRKKTVCVTRGNGSSYVLVIKAKDGDRNLEDLASGRSHPSNLSKYVSMVLAALWFALLVTATSAKNHPWYLLAVGLLGMLQNIYAAGGRRSPEAHGIPLQREQVIEDIKVMQALEKAETQYPGLGHSLLTAFFPKGLGPEEVEWWNSRAPKADATNALAQIVVPRTQPPPLQIQPVSPQTQPASPQIQPTSPQASNSAPET